MKITKEDLLGLILIPLFFLLMSKPVQLPTSNKPCVFLDYRPGYKCLAFEKLP